METRRYPNKWRIRFGSLGSTDHAAVVSVSVTFVPISVACSFQGLL
uniref:Uncharacterized protein n=1 Tax=Arundo donax TaxID=35708 RepID=A0A0A9H6D9_ARUDO